MMIYFMIFMMIDDDHLFALVFKNICLTTFNKWKYTSWFTKNVNYIFAYQIKLKLIWIKTLWSS